jgi:hypothetical protein
MQQAEKKKHPFTPSPAHPSLSEPRTLNPEPLLLGGIARFKRVVMAQKAELYLPVAGLVFDSAPVDRRFSLEVGE